MMMGVHLHVNLATIPVLPAKVIPTNSVAHLVQTLVLLIDISCLVLAKREAAHATLQQGTLMTVETIKYANCVTIRAHRAQDQGLITVFHVLVLANKEMTKQMINTVVFAWTITMMTDRHCFANLAITAAKHVQDLESKPV